MLQRRLGELLAIALIGEGVAGFLAPRRYVRLWKFGPVPYRAVVDWLAERPALTRVLCVLEAGVGVWLTWRQTHR